MKKHNIFKVVCIAILIAVLLTWIVPSSYYYGGIVDNGKAQMGIFDLFSYLGSILSYFGYVPLYILAVGGFYGVLYKTNGYRNLLNKLVDKYEGSEWIFLTIVMILFAVITSVSGLSLGLFFLFPFVITTILLMGYSKITALLTTVGSVCIGLIGTSYSLTEMATVNEYLGLSAASELIVKLVMLVVGLILLIVNTLLYARKHRINSPRKGFLYPETTNEKAKTWPIAFVFDAVLVVMILSFVSWTSAFEITFFEDLLTNINEFKIGEFPIFAKLIGGISAFGNWSLTDLTVLVVIASGFVALLSKVSFNDMVKGFGLGAKKALKPAFIASIVYIFIFIAAYHPYTITIMDPIMSLTDTFNVVTTAITSFISHLFNVEMYYSASNTLGYITSVITDTSVYGVVGVIWQATYGLAMLFVPTSVILVAGLAYLNVSYCKWLKAVWKLLLQLIVALLVIFLIIAMI